MCCTGGTEYLSRTPDSHSVCATRTLVWLTVLVIVKSTIGERQSAKNVKDSTTFTSQARHQTFNLSSQHTNTVGQRTPTVVNFMRSCTIGL